MKIKKLTKKQEILLQNTLQKWLAIGRRTAPLNRDKVKVILNKFYKRINKKNPNILFFSSPLMCLIAYYFLYNLKILKFKDKNSQIQSNLDSQFWSPIQSQLWYQLDSQLYSKVDSQLDSHFQSKIRIQLQYQLQSQLQSQLYSQLYSQIQSQIQSRLQSQLDSQLYSKIDSQLDSQLQSQLYSQLHSQIDFQLNSHLQSKIRFQLQSQPQSQFQSQINNYFGGGEWCSWEIFYDFCNQIGVQYTKKEKSLLNLWKEQCEEMHWWFPYENVVLVSEHPKFIKIDKLGRLHSENSKALEYSDGWGFYSLDGVIVPEYLVLTPKEKLNPKLLLIDKELKENVEIRRIFVKKVGIERCLSVLKWNVLDKKEKYLTYSNDKTNLYTEYELGETFIIENSPRRYLKMLNPSTQTWHLEAVHPECNTVQEALNWRATGDKNKMWEPFILS